MADQNPTPGLPDYRVHAFNPLYSLLALPRWHSGKESACQCRRRKRHGFDPWVRKIFWRRKWQPTPIFLPGKCHGQRSLVGYSPWAHKELDTTELQNTTTHTHACEINPISVHKQEVLNICLLCEWTLVEGMLPGSPWCLPITDIHSKLLTLAKVCCSLSCGHCTDLKYWYH